MIDRVELTTVAEGISFWLCEIRRELDTTTARFEWLKMKLADLPEHIAVSSLGQSPPTVPAENAAAPEPAASPQVESESASSSTTPEDSPCSTFGGNCPFDPKDKKCPTCERPPSLAEAMQRILTDPSTWDEPETEHVRLVRWRDWSALKLAWEAYQKQDRPPCVGCDRGEQCMISDRARRDAENMAMPCVRACDWLREQRQKGA